MDKVTKLNHAKRILTSLGISPKMLGYIYLTELFDLTINENKIFPLYKEGYEALSRLHKKSASSIDKAIQNAINKACNYTENAELYKLFGATIDEKRGKPTNKHLISTVIETIR